MLLNWFILDAIRVSGTQSYDRLMADTNAAESPNSLQQ